MKRKPGYLLQNISGSFYLLPYGQLAASRRRGLRINESGAFVWRLLEKEMSREELLKRYIAHYSDGPDASELERDLNMFLDTLLHLGAAEDDPPEFEIPESDSFYLRIADIRIKIDCPRELIFKTFLKDFTDARGKRPDLYVTAEKCDPGADENKDLKNIITDPELEVYELSDGYYLKFPTFSEVKGVTLSEFGDRARIFCDFDDSDALSEQFFHVMRHIFLYLAQRKGMYALHSVSLLYGGKALLLSAQSGTGKSTHAALWKKLFGVNTLNGDLNLLSFERGEFFVRGIPWCGTSETYSTDKVKLGGIALLKQGASDAIEDLSETEKALLTLTRSISPIWLTAQLREGAQFFERLAKKIPVCRLWCTLNDSAAEVLKSWADSQGFV